MKITRNNYELYAIDFVDGILSPPEVAEFMVFLEDNPDISNEVELVRDTSLETPKVKKKVDFSYLKKDLNTNEVDEINFEEFCILYYENDLSEEGKDRVLNFIEANPSFKSKFELFGKLKLVSDSKIVYPNKRLLKKKNVLSLTKRKTTVTVMLLVASFLALFIFRPPSNNINNIVSDNNSTVYKQPNTESNNKTKLIPVESTNKNNNVEIKREDIKQTPIIAVLDTSNLNEYKFARISMREVSIIEPSYKRDIKVRLNSYNNTKKENYKNISEKEKRILNSVTKVRFNNVIKTGINGLNQIAETEIKYNTKTDEEGRVTEFALSYDNFNIRRKLRN